MVVGNASAVVITSSPGRSGFLILFEQSVATARRLAEEPVLTARISPEPKNRANLSSKSCPL